MESDNSFLFVKNDITYIIKYDKDLSIQAIYYDDYMEWTGVISDSTLNDPIDNTDNIDVISYTDSTDNTDNTDNTHKSSVSNSNMLGGSKLINIKYDSKQIYEILCKYKNNDLKKSMTLKFPKFDEIKYSNICIIIETSTHYVKNSFRQNIVIEPILMTSQQKMEKIFNHNFNLQKQKLEELEENLEDLKEKYKTQQVLIESLVKNMALFKITNSVSK